MTNEAGLEFGTIADGTVSINKYRGPTDVQRQAALNEMRMVEEMGEKADLKIHGCVAVNHWHTFKRALQSPRVLVIPGLGEAINVIAGCGNQDWDVRLNPKLDIILKAARAYDELQKGGLR